MVFDDGGLLVFIDPSYFCTGVWACVPSRKAGWFSGFGEDRSKRTMQGYWLSALRLSREFGFQVHDMVSAARSLLGNFSVPSLTVVMEAPFPRGEASAGLYGLQFLFLDRLEGLGEAEGLPFTFYSLSSSFIHGQFRRECGDDAPRIRKEWVRARCDELVSDGWAIGGLDGLRRKGCDRQTAFGFWWFLSHGDKELEPFQLGVGAGDGGGVVAVDDGVSLSR